MLELLLTNTPSKKLTNFDNSDLELYRLAVKVYNEKNKQTILFISNIADWGNNNISENSSSLHTIESGDRSDFWDMFDRLRDVIKSF